MSTTSELVERLKTRFDPRIVQPDELSRAAALRLTELEADNARLREAVRFYRDAWQWDGVSSPLEPSGDLLDDRGQRARAALTGEA